MTTCIIIGIVVQCTLAPSKLTPDQAADILRPGQYVHVPRSYPLPPPSTVVPVSTPQAEPLGLRRLDGTLLSTPRWSAEVGTVPLTVYVRDLDGRPRVYTQGQPIGLKKAVQ